MARQIVLDTGIKVCHTKGMGKIYPDPLVACRNGHPREHTFTTPRGDKCCRLCERAARNRYYNRSKAVRAPINALNDRRLRRKKRDKLLAFFGNKCARCGFDDRRALHIDHINGGGTQESKEIGGTSSPAFHKKAYSNPELYQILCANCNAIKIWENGERRTKYH
jgi:hypothetical protein